MSLVSLRRKRGGPAEGAQPQRGRATRSTGELRRERRLLLGLREARLHDLGGLVVEMYRQDSFREGLLYEQCAELVAMEERLAEVDGLLSGVRVVRTSACACGAPLSPTSRFCANCGRPAGQRTVAACRSCGHALAADARFCPVCGTPAGDDSSVALGAGDTRADGA